MPSSFLWPLTVLGQPISSGTATQPLPLSSTDSTHAVHTHRSSLMCRHDCRTNSLLPQELSSRQIPGLIKPTLVSPENYNPVSSGEGTLSHVPVIRFEQGQRAEDITSVVCEDHSGTTSPRCWLGAIRTQSQYPQMQALKWVLLLENQMALPPGEKHPFH